MKQVVCLLVAMLAAGPTFAQVNCNEGMEPIDAAAESSLGTMDFVQAVAAREQDFVRAFGTYAYTVDITVQTLQGDAIDGEFRQVSTYAYDSSGARRATVTGGPTNTLSRLKLSDKDINGLNDMLPFAFTQANLADLDVVYSGRQKMGEINTSVFDALARASQSPGRGFQGRAWVHTRERAIIKTCSRYSASPVAPMRFDSVRQEVGGKYWFPTLLRADEDMEVAGDKVHIRVTVKYSDYQPRP